MIEATEVDYLITNVSSTIVTPQWIITTYSQRNWIEVFYRNAKGWLGLKEYQVRDIQSLTRHFILVFTAYTFIIWHQLTGGFRRRWATKELKTFAVACFSRSELLWKHLERLCLSVSLIGYKKIRTYLPLTKLV